MFRSFSLNVAVYSILVMLSFGYCIIYISEPNCFSEFWDMPYWSIFESLICMTVFDPWRLPKVRNDSLVFYFLVKLNFEWIVSMGFMSHIIVSGMNKKLLSVELLKDCTFCFLSLMGLYAFIFWYFMSDWSKYFSSRSYSLSFEIWRVMYLFCFCRRL